MHGASCTVSKEIPNGLGVPERNTGQTFSYISGVQEGAMYELAIMAVSDLGVMSQQSPVRSS